MKDNDFSYVTVIFMDIYYYLDGDTSSSPLSILSFFVTGSYYFRGAVANKRERIDSRVILSLIIIVCNSV